MSRTQTAPEELTPEEVAGCFRLPVEMIECQAREGRIPGRRTDNTWRFHRADIDDWLRGPSGRSIAIRQAGALRDDDSLVDLRRSIYVARGRPEGDDDTAD